MESGTKKINQNSIYGKINSIDIEDQSTTTTTKLEQYNESKAFIVTITLATLIVITIIFIAIISIMSTSTYNTQSSSSSSSSYSSDDSIKLICNTTRYPDTCFKSISPSYCNTTDPESIFKLSLQIAIAEISTLSSFIETANLNVTLAVKDCVDLLNDAVSRLNDSVTVMTVGAGEKILTEKKISDIQTWVSAALTDQETCTDGLEDVESTVVIDVKNKVEKSKQYVSNALAILANIMSLLDKFGLTLH